MKKMKSKAEIAFKKSKQKSVAWWKNKAWNVFSKWIRERDNYTCITCGKKGEGSFMHAGHYISRKHCSTMFNEKNVHAQCMNCNIWGYGNTGVYTQKLITMYGCGIIDELVKESKKIKQFTIQELQGIIEKYNGK